MNNILRNLLIAAAVLAGTFFGGYYVGKGDKEIQIQEKVVYKEGESKTVYRDKIVTVTKTIRPDGTVVETTKTEDKTGSKETKTTENTKDKDTLSKPSLSKYSVGVAAVRRWDEDWNKTPDYGVTAGTRIWGEVWLKGGVVPNQKTVQLGLELQL